jgi:hypothetical protein
MTDDRNDWELTGEEIARRILELAYVLEQSGAEEGTYIEMANLGARLARIYTEIAEEWKELDRGD